MEIKIKGTSDNGNVELKAKIPVIGGGPVFPCVDIDTQIPFTAEECAVTPLTMPFLQLDNGDFIPLVFFGAGEASLKINKTTETFTGTIK